MIVMIDNGCEEPIQELDYFLNFHEEYLKINPAIIAVTHYDDFNTDTHLIDYHQYVMQHGFDCTVMSLDARNKEQLRKVILKLLIEIIRRR